MAPPLSSPSQLNASLGPHFQAEMGIAGSSAQEIETTIEGSTNAMKAAWQNMLVGLVIAFLITYMHKPNIERLKAGTENKFSFKSSKSNDSDDKKTD